MSSYNVTEALIEKANEENKQIISDFTSYLESLNLSKKTIKRHEGNIYFFAEYLNHYANDESEVKNTSLY